MLFTNHLLIMMHNINFFPTQLAGAEEYIESTLAEGYVHPNKSPGYSIKQSDGKIPVILEL